MTQEASEQRDATSFPMKVLYVQGTNWV